MISTKCLQIIAGPRFNKEVFNRTGCCLYWIIKVKCKCILKGGIKLKNIKFLTQFKHCSFKTKVVIATMIMGIVFISLGGINNINCTSNTTSVDKHIQVFGGVYQTQYGVTTASSLRVRTGASTKYSSVANMKKGTKVVITGKTNNFYKITYGGKTRYISALYVKITAKPKLLIDKIKNKGNAKQAIVVATSSYSNVNATIMTFENVNGIWKQIGSFAGNVGNKGFIYNKVEGDGHSPIGIFFIGHGIW